MKQINNENVVEIKMFPTAHCFCHLGQDWYSLPIEITFIPNKYYPDYMDVQKWVEENVNGKELNIEQALANIAAYLKSEYSPYDVTVIGDATDAITHFPVRVTVK